MSFFIKNRKRKQSRNRTQVKSKQQKQNKKNDIPSSRKQSRFMDEEIESEDSVDSDNEVHTSKTDDTYLSEDSEEETAQEKKLRLVKQYLSQLEEEESSKREDKEIHKDIISHRLKQDLLEQTGRLQKKVADDYIEPTDENIMVLRGHKLPVTCVVITPDDRHIFTGSKDCSIIKWDVHSGKKVHVIPGGKKSTQGKHACHTSHVMCLAISSDGKYLASGDRDKLIHIWNPDTCEKIHTFTGHRDTVSGLAFRKGSHQLFSASHDRSVKIWNLDEMSYVETLFGHQDCITGIDSLSRERAVTSGGRDGSVRVWKVIEESQLVFHGHSGSIDCISLINESNFISGADDNSLALWSVMKKKPLVIVKNAHCGQNNNTAEENWITSVVSLQNTDLVASGSKDGSIRFWKCCNDMKQLQPMFSLSVIGFVNSMQFSKDGSFLVAGIGQEHKLGRWWRLKEAKNCINIVKLQKKNDES